MVLPRSGHRSQGGILPCDYETIRASWLVLETARMALQAGGHAPDGRIRPGMVMTCRGRAGGGGGPLGLGARSFAARQNQNDKANVRNLQSPKLQLLQKYLKKELICQLL